MWSCRFLLTTTGKWRWTCYAPKLALSLNWMARSILAMPKPTGVTGGRTRCCSKMDISYCDSWRKMRASASTTFWTLFWPLLSIVKMTPNSMFERFERELLPNERRLVTRSLSRRQARQKRGWRFGLLFCLIVSALLSLPVLLSGEGPWYLVLGLIVPGVGLSVVWGSISARKESNFRIRELEEVLSKNRASVIHIKSDKMVEFEEIEDEGACYAFQVAENKIAFVCGQDYYASAKFPNTDFCLIAIYTRAGSPVEGGIEKLGQKL